MSNTTVVLPYSGLDPFTILPTMSVDAESQTLSPSSSASSSSSEDAPPEHLFSDYVEMAYLGVVILVGCCINLHILFKLIQEKKKNSNNKTMSGFLLLKINLNISDLLILTVHAFGKLIWLAEYEWRFGEALCRSFNFLSMFTLYLSSNIVVCIALDRLRTVLRAKRITLLRRKRHLIRVFLVAAWMLAFIWSLPQLYFWKTYNVFPNYPGGWIQCTDIWSIERYERFLHSNRSTTQSVLLSDFVQNLYDLTHLFFVFYGPLIVLIICYLFISVRLMHFATTGGTQRAVAAVNPSMISINTHHDVKGKYIPLRSSMSTTTTMTSANPTPRARGSINSEAHMLNNRRESGPYNGYKTPNIPQIIYEHPTGTPNESVVDNNVDEADLVKPCDGNIGNGHAKKKTIILRSFSSSDVYARANSDDYVNSDERKRIFQKNTQSKAKEKRSSTIISNTGSSPRKIKNRLRSLMRAEINESSCSSSSSGDPDETSPLDECSFSEGYNQDSGTFLYSAVSPHSAGSLNKATIKPRRNSSLPSSTKHALTQHYNSLALRMTRIRSSFNGGRNVEGKWGALQQKFNYSNCANGKENTGPKVPLWRSHLRSRVFRTTVLVVLAHVLLWLPYNSYAAMKYINADLYTRMNEQANVFKDLQFLITIINPFLYGFTR